MAGVHGGGTEEAGTRSMSRRALTETDPKLAAYLKNKGGGIIKHGLSRTPTYRSWVSMLGRCRDPDHVGFKNYGGKGIKVCERWHSLSNFIADMGMRPSLDHSIERIRSSEDYAPGNCRWATIVEQNNNTTRNHFIEFNGKRQTLAQWAREIRVPHDTLRHRIYSGWPTDKALTTPLRKRIDNRTVA